MMSSAGRPVDLQGWLQSLDLEQYLGRFQSSGFFEPGQCVSLTDGSLLRDLNVKQLSHRETLLSAIHQLARAHSSDNLSEDSWEWEQSSSSRNSLAISTSNTGPPSPLPQFPSSEEFDLPPPPPDLVTPPYTGPQTAFDMPPPPPPMPGQGYHMDSMGMNGVADNWNLSNVRGNGNMSVPVVTPQKMMFKQASLINLSYQQEEIDLDMLLADLEEIEQASMLPAPPSRSPSSRPLSSLSTQSSSASLNVKPPVVKINSTARPDTDSPVHTPPPPPPQQTTAATAMEDDDFSKILADLESLTSSGDLPSSGARPLVENGNSSHSYAGNTQATSGLLRQPSELDLMHQINLLSGSTAAPSAHVSAPPSTQQAMSPSASSWSSTSMSGSQLSSSRPISLASSEPFTPSSSSATSTLSTPRHDAASAVSPHPSISSASSSSELEVLNALSARLSRELRASDALSNAAPEEAQPQEAQKEVTNVRTVPNQCIIRLPTSQALVKVNEELAHLEKDLARDGTLSREQKESRLKQAKVQVAMDKLKEANKKKLVLKAYNDDGSSKMIVIDEMMTSYEVVQRLIKKNRVKPSPNFVLIEQLAEHFIERRIEDHEVMVPILECWGVNSPNTILFTEKPDKYMLFKRPQLFMPPGHDYAPGRSKKSTVSEPKKRDLILKDLFVAQALPDLEGNLMVKEGRKGPWKRHFFVFRKSGLYFSPKGKTVATKDLQRFTDLKDVLLYTGEAYRKKYKAPTDMCFTLKKFLSADSRKMLHFCVETVQEMNAWTMSVRVARFGTLLQENYERTNRDMPWIATDTEEEIDGLVRMQQQERLTSEGHHRVQRSSSIGSRLRLGTGSNNTLRKNEKGPRTSRAATVAAAEFTLRSRGSVHLDARPHSSFSGSVANPDDEDEEDEVVGSTVTRTPFQQMFGSAWKQSQQEEEDAIESRRIELIEPDFKDGEDFSPTPMATSPFLSSEDGMYNLRLT